MVTEQNRRYDKYTRNRRSRNTRDHQSALNNQNANSKSNKSKAREGEGKHSKNDSNSQKNLGNPLQFDDIIDDNDFFKKADIGRSGGSDSKRQTKVNKLQKSRTNTNNLSKKSPNLQNSRRTRIEKLRGYNGSRGMKADSFKKEPDPLENMVVGISVEKRRDIYGARKNPQKKKELNDDQFQNETYEQNSFVSSMSSVTNTIAFGNESILGNTIDIQRENNKKTQRHVSYDNGNCDVSELSASVVDKRVRTIQRKKKYYPRLPSIASSEDSDSTPTLDYYDDDDDSDEYTDKCNENDLSNRKRKLKRRKISRRTIIITSCMTCVPISCAIAVITGWYFLKYIPDYELAYLQATSHPPTQVPSSWPSDIPSILPSIQPSTLPSVYLSSLPSILPSVYPSSLPSILPSQYPSQLPTTISTSIPSAFPSFHPSSNPSQRPSAIPTQSPSKHPTKNPTKSPSQKPTKNPTKSPSQKPTKQPTSKPTPKPTSGPTTLPSKVPTKSPSHFPTIFPTAQPTPTPTIFPTKFFSSYPSISFFPTFSPTTTSKPSRITPFPTVRPTKQPTKAPTVRPTKQPTKAPTFHPTTSKPSKRPTSNPTPKPTQTPSISFIPTLQPTAPTLSLSEPFSFLVVGDVPYDEEEIDIFRSQVSSISPSNEFIVHVGDMTRASYTQCRRSDYETVDSILQQSSIPVFIVLGDNDYMDCPNPYFALTRWKLHFAQYHMKYDWAPNSVNGIKFLSSIEYQSRRNENMVFFHKGILFLFLHIVGEPLQGLGSWPEAEFEARHSDNLSFTKSNLSKYRRDENLRGVVIFGHAKPRRSLHSDFFDPLLQYVNNVPQFRFIPFLYLHGDGHDYEESYDFNTRSGIRLSNFKRIQVEQGANEGPLRVHVSPNRAITEDVFDGSVVSAHSNDAHFSVERGIRY